jgi:hypothetical protein
MQCQTAVFFCANEGAAGMAEGTVKAGTYLLAAN